MYSGKNICLVFLNGGELIRQLCLSATEIRDSVKSKAARGACCDNDVFEHFKCLYETGMHAVAHETDDGWIAYNCTVNEDGISVTDKYVDKIRIFVKQAGIVCVNGKEYRLEKGAHYLSNENYWGIDREKNK